MSDTPDIPGLEAAFRTVDARMKGLPIHNPALEVTAAFFRPWEGLWVGVMITPWAINLVILPAGHAAWKPLGPDEHQDWTFPSGDYVCMGMNLEGFGPLHFCSLFSPALQFADQAAAVAAARAAMEALFSATAELAPSAEQAGTPLADAAAEAREPISERNVSRRDFLRGRLFGR